MAGKAALEPDEICPPEDEEIEISMTKNSYITGNMGEPITQCKSVLEILQLMYDLVVSKYGIHNAEFIYLCMPLSQALDRCPTTLVRAKESEFSPTPKFYMTKGFWVSDVRFLESELPEAHAKDTVPRLANMKCYEEFRLVGEEEREISMFEHRYIPSSVGERITRCESVLEILYLMYDLVVSKHMVLITLIITI
jgi:hypothetical protein